MYSTRIIAPPVARRRLLPWPLLQARQPQVPSLSISSATSDETPFYGAPRPPNSRRNSLKNRLAIAIHSATTAFADPTRADAVAALGEVTGTISLERMRSQLQNTESGRQILLERPVVSKASIPYERLMNNNGNSDNNVTFGQAYGTFLKTHGFDPDGRDPVRYIPDDELAYIMLRYRQCHDFWHTLTGLPPTVLGELALKWLELFQTGLPIAALSSTVGSLRLSGNERQILWQHYLPWATEQSQNLTMPLMAVYYEKEFDTPLKGMRERLNLQAAPQLEG